HGFLRHDDSPRGAPTSSGRPRCAPATCFAGRATAARSRPSFTAPGPALGSLRVRLLVEEVVHLALRFVLRAPVAFLDLAGQDLRVAVNLVEVVIRELAPLLAYLAPELLPLSLERVLVHCCASSFANRTGRLCRTGAVACGCACRGIPATRRVPTGCKL